MDELFEYYRPKNFQELDSLIKKYCGEDIGFLAGGTDLIVKLKSKGIITFKKLIDIKKLNLDFIKIEKNVIRIGSTTTLSSLLQNDYIMEKYPILTNTITDMASVQVRNRGTMGGNICNAAPSADLVPPLIVLDAILVVRRSGKEEKIKIEEFFKGPGVTKLLEGDLLEEIHIPIEKSKRCSSVYLKAKRTSEDICLAGVAVKLSLNDIKKCDSIRLALSAVGPTPLRAKEAEKVIKNNIIDESIIEKAAKAATEESKCIDDVRSNKNYRRHIIYLYTKKAIKMAYEEILKKIKNK